ncbi:MAG: hypothetical protein AB7P21_04760 [Lautropia sp.]
MLSRRDLVALLIVLGASALLRYAVVEPVAIRHACGAAPWDGWCGPRSLVMLPFRHREIGWFALLSASAAFVIHLRGAARAATALAERLARIGLLLGAAGLLLYSADPAAVAALLSAVTLARIRARAHATPAVASA